MSRRKKRKVIGDLQALVLLFLAVVVCILLPFSYPRSQTTGPTVLPGQSVTLLPDGRWLLLGGETNNLNSASIWNPSTGATTELSSRLNYGRAWHTATVLPDGTIFIFGGIGANNEVIQNAELFDPASQTFSALPSSDLTGRARHTATLLTDGSVLIVGGVASNNQAVATAERWDYLDGSVTRLPQLTTARQGHSATLTDGGNVLIKGGTDRYGDPLNTGDLFDPSTQRFSSVDSATLDLIVPPATPYLVASVPLHNSVDVPIDSILSLRFSKSLRPETVNSETVTLTGPNGIERIRIVVAEGGMLAFIRPEEDLLPGATYTVTISGAADNTGLLLPASGVSFTTEPSASSSQPADPTTSSVSGRPETKDSKPETIRDKSDDDWEWKGKFKDGKPRSDWEDLAPLQAAAGVTALAGQVLDLRGLPLANVTLRMDAAYGGSTSSVQTDNTGRFLLTKIKPGWGELVIDGRRAHNPKSKSENPKWGYGVFEYGLEIIEKKTNVLPFTIWLPKIDTAHAVKIPSPTTSQVIVTSPRIPGLELHIPPDTVIEDHEGKVVNEISLTRIPLDRTPFPLARNVQVPLYFTAQPGGAYIHTSGRLGARIIYPNHTGQPAGARFDFWHYDTAPRGWYIYGGGAVSNDGTQVVPDPAVSIYEFSGAMFSGGVGPPLGPPPGPEDKKPKEGDPVDVATGLFVLTKTDLFLPDIIPIRLTRTYRPEDSNSRPFGIGTTHPYNIFFQAVTNYSEAHLILPDGGRIRYTCIAGADCSFFTTAQLEHTSTQTQFYKSKVVWNGLGWNLTLKNGTVYVFGDNTPLHTIRDRYGNQITITRAGGNITRITASPSNRWIEFTYDSSPAQNCAVAGTCIVQARDNIGRVVNYEYDTNGRLHRVTDPEMGVTQYTYDVVDPLIPNRKTRMLTITDARGIQYLTNQYDLNSGRVTRQTLAPGTEDEGIYQFVYTVDGMGRVTQTDITDPRLNRRRVTFNTDGQILTDARADNDPVVRQTMTYALENGTSVICSPLGQQGRATNLLCSKTDNLAPQNRRTEYTYDAMGNMLTVTRLAGTPQAVTTTYTYEPTFNQVTNVTDPLNHTTTFGYDTSGNLRTMTQRPDGSTNLVTNLDYNPDGQPISITDPLMNTTRFEYDVGDLSAIINPLLNRTERITDAAGRLLLVTDPLGQTTSYEHDRLNRLRKVTDPRSGITEFTYDPNSNLQSVKDARNNTTTYTYDNMDRLKTRTDPLQGPGSTETYAYDAAGNLRQFIDRKNQSTTYTYDALNRRSTATYQDTSSTTYNYDLGNRLTGVVDSIAGTITRDYDGLNRLKFEITPQGRVDYTYDNGSRRETMTVQGQSQISYLFDDINRLKEITQGASTVTIGYDNASRRTSLTLPNGVLVEYGYDEASRVTSIMYKRGMTVLGDLTYEYDKAGRRTKIGGSFARTGIPQAVSTTVYNAANRQTTFGDKTLDYDNNGNLISIADGAGTTLYTWNARNQLTGISGPGVNATFVYDGLGRREKKTISGNLTEFLFDGVNPVQETSGVPVVANILTGLRVDEFFSRTDVPAAVTSYFLPDALGSSIGLADSAGTVQTEYTYEPFGKTTAAGTSSSNPFQYAARENDGTGLYYYRARYYHPQLQRFISEDPIGFLADINLFTYVSNNPLFYIDPFGFEKCKASGECNPKPRPPCATMDCNPKPRPPEPPCKTPAECFGPGPQPNPPAPDPAPAPPPKPQEPPPPSRFESLRQDFNQFIENLREFNEQCGGCVEKTIEFERFMRELK